MAWKEVNNHSCDFFTLWRTICWTCAAGIKLCSEAQERWAGRLRTRRAAQNSDSASLGTWELDTTRRKVWGWLSRVHRFPHVGEPGVEGEACAWNIGKGKTEFAQSMNQYHRSFLFSKLIHNLVKTCVSESIWMDGGLLIATWLED